MKVLPRWKDDLHEHIHLENSILFPKAIAMEAEAKLLPNNVKRKEDTLAIKLTTVP